MYNHLFAGLTMAEPSDFKALAGQIGSIVTRLRRNVAKNTTGGTTTGTSVKSTIGYVRWSAQNDEASSDGVPTQEPEISLDPAETEKDCATDSSVSSDDAVHESLMSDSEHPSCSSSMNIEIPEEPPTNKVDTITEWQAGWNVTNAIQVSRTSSLGL